MAKAPVLHVPIQGGMRQDLSDIVAPNGTIKSCTNVRFPYQGELQARSGTDALSTATGADTTPAQLVTSGGPSWLAPCDGGFVFGRDGYAFRYDFAAARVHAAGSYANAVPDGIFASVAKEQIPYTLGDSIPWPVSVAVGGGYIAICWSTGNGNRNIEANTNYQIVEMQIYTADGACIGTYSNSSYRVGWVIYEDLAGAFILFVQAAASTAVTAAAVIISGGDMAVGSFDAIATLNAADDPWAVVNWPGNGWAFFYPSGATTLSLVDGTGSGVGTPTNITVGASGSPISLCCTSTHAYVGWVDVGTDCDAVARAYNTSLVNTSGGDVTIYSDAFQTSVTLTAPLMTQSVAGAGTVFGVIGRSTNLSGDPGANTWLQAFSFTSAGTLTSGATKTYHMWPATPPFNTGMIWCKYRTPNDTDKANNYVRNVLLDFMADRQSGAASAFKLVSPRVALVGDAFADLQGGEWLGGTYFVQTCAPQAIETDHWIVGLQRLVRSEQFTGDVAHGLSISEWLKFYTDRPVQTYPLGDETIVPGSPVLVSKVGTKGTVVATGDSDQKNGIDLGFLAELAIDAPTQGTSGSLTTAGVYKYRAVVEWVDGLGRRWRGRPSAVRNVTMLSSNNKNVFSCADDYSFLRQFGIPESGVVKHFYRTTDKGSTFYRVSPPQGVLLASAATAFVDTMSDAQASTREILYTDGGVLANDHPPSCQHIRATEERVWCAGLWDKKQAQSSKILVPGEPPQFSDSPAFRISIPEDITGIGIQDGMVVLFSRFSIYVVQGAGPNDQGQGAWETPRCISRSSGCLDGRSVLETSVGIFFQSDRGIELLPRGAGDPVFIGAAVQSSTEGLTIASCSVVKSAESTTARFITTTGVVLLYDLDMQAWSLDTYPVGVRMVCDTASGAVIAKADMSGGYGFYLEQTDADQDSVGDSPQDIASTIAWADLRPFGPAGQGRFTSALGLFAEKASPSSGYRSGNATITLATDRNSESGLVFDMSSLSDPDYRRAVPLQPAGTRAKLTLATTVAGWRFGGWTVEVTEEPGGRRMGETEQG